MTRMPQDHGNDALLNEAASWFTRLNEAQGRARQTLEREFLDWLAADPARAEAFARVSEAWIAVDGHAAAPEMMALRRDALDDAQNAARARWRGRSSPGQIASVAAIVLCLVGAAALYGLTLVGTGDRYATAIGERRTVTLADNSRVAIDADSAISVEFEERLRLVHLEKGQAFFDVEKDPTRPFVVEAAGRRVVALGTAFNVELLANELRVTLVEGRVAVRSTSSPPLLPALGTEFPPGVAELKPGEQLAAIGRAAPLITRPANVAAATSWREGKLIFDDEPLADAVARMQRYSRIRIAVADKSLNAIKISGVFNAGDVTAFVGALKTYFLIDATMTPDGEIRLRHRS